MTAALSSLPDWVTRRARTHPAQLAIEAYDASGTLERLTYRDLSARVSSLVTRLRASGEPLEAPVGLLAANGVPFAVCAHAVPASGAPLMPLNARLTVEELAWQLEDSGARLLIVDGAYAEIGREAARRAALEVWSAEDVTQADGLEERGTLEDGVHAPSAVHSVVYTSGTSGKPKGALLTYGNFEASAAASAYNLGVDPRDRWLACLPLFHVGGLSILLRSAMYGTTAVVHERFDEAAVNAALRDDRITVLSVVPTMLQRMLAADRDGFPSSVRAVLVGGGPVAPALLEDAMARGLPVLQTYGLTETASQVTTLSSADALRRLGSAGQPLLPTRIRVEIDGREALPGEVGEILVAGPTVSPGYLARPDATEAAIRGGWLHTGDLGAVDDEGYLTVADRRDDLVVTGGENVYPAEVEAALLGCPGVLECAVVGLPDPRWGHIVAAVVVVEPGASLDGAAVEAHARARLAGYKVPRRIEVTRAPLPRTASGKLLRRVVREQLAPSSDG